MEDYSMHWRKSQHLRTDTGLRPIHFICNHVRTQTNSEPQAATLLGIFPIINL